LFKEQTMFKKFLVKKDERALLFRKGDFVEILAPGEYLFVDVFGHLALERYSLAKPWFEHRLADYLIKAEPALIAREFTRVELGSTEVGLRYENGILVEVLAPNTRRLYWKGYVDVRVDKIDVGEDLRIDSRLVPQLVEFAGTTFRARVTGASEVYAVQVPQHQVAILYLNGKLADLLEPGLYGFWRFGHDVRAEFVDLRLQALEVSGQEILTKDKVALRVNLSASYRITDVREAYAKQAKPVDFLYRELQFGLRAAVGTRTLDELLENKHVIDEVVAAHVRKAIVGFGVAVDGVGVKDIILPGEMKTILAKVVEAEKAAQANVIRRREETAATRSLLNTAKVMEDNPVALRLKELETLEKVTEKIDKISVFGGLEGVLQDLVKIKP
jgi:regulator of protease activity HflC (stomatin/prohibitin superfamily)